MCVCVRGRKSEEERERLRKSVLRQTAEQLFVPDEKKEEQGHRVRDQRDEEYEK